MSSLSQSEVISTRHNLTLFIGADLPEAITGLPPRAELAAELARRHGLDEGWSLAEVAQRVSRGGHRFEFTEFLRRALDTAGKVPQPFHHGVAGLVARYGVRTLITTAYDDLLEQALKQAGIGFDRVLRGSDVHFTSPERLMIIKLYGDVHHPDTLVVTDQDHLDLLRNRDKAAMLDEVRQAFRHDTVLFLGYNLADPDFRFVFDQVAESRFARTAYAVWPGLPAADVAMWRDRGILILPADPWGILSEQAMLTPSGGCREPSVPVMVSAKDLALVQQLRVLLSPERVPPPVQPHHQELPFNQLSWEQFEALCAALIEAQPTTLDCHLYGVKGDHQQGIDVVATQRGEAGNEVWVYQCKRYRDYTAERLRQALADMRYPADYYVIMLSVPATAAMRQAVAERPNVFVWDSRDIARKLKLYPVIVQDFFGPVWRRAFCG